MSYYPKIDSDFLRKIPRFSYAFPRTRDTKVYEKFYGALVGDWRSRGFMQDPHSRCADLRSVYDSYYSGTHHASTVNTCITVNFNEDGMYAGFAVSGHSTVNPTNTMVLVPPLAITNQPDPRELAIMRLEGDYKELTSFFRPVTVTEMVVAIERFTQNHLKMTRNLSYRPEDFIAYPLGAY